MGTSTTADSPERGSSLEPPGRGPDYFASLRILKRHSAGLHRPLISSVVFSTLSVALDIVVIWAIWRLCTGLMDQTADFGFFIENAVIMLVAVITGQLTFGISTAQAHVAAFGLIREVRIELSNHIARMPLGWLTSRSSGEAKKLVIDDPEQLETLTAHGIPEGLGALLTWLAISVWLFLVDWRMALATIVLTPISFVLLGRAMKTSAGQAAAYQVAFGKMNAAIVEYLAGMPVLKVFNRTGESFAGTAEAVRAYTRIETDMGRRYIFTGGTFQALVLANITVILPVGLWLLNTGRIDAATLVFFAIVGGNYSAPLLKLFGLFHRFAHISMISTLIEDVLKTEPQSDTGRRINLPNTGIAFENVSFAYGAHDVLHGVTFTARAGSVTALVGPSGSGKSTLAALVPRFHDVREGRITIGGIDVRDIGLDQLMDTVAFVFQDTFLFSGTIAENIRFGKPSATDAEVCAAAEAARAHDFITALPAGYETRIGEKGRMLSGGERQRIAIARAILKDAPIIILDEATAFADPDNEAAIQEAISALSRRKTLIVVAHRLHTIVSAAQIVVMERGRVAQAGTHEDLLAQGGLYGRLWDDYTRAKAVDLRGPSSNTNKNKEAAE